MANWGEILTQALPWATVFGGAVVWLFERRSRRAETDKKRSDAVDGISEIYKKMVEDTDKELEEMRKQIAILKTEIEESRKERNELTKKVEALTMQTNRDQRTIEKLKKEIEKLKNYNANNGHRSD